MTDDSGKTPEQIIAERRARLQEEMRGWDELGHLRSEIDRLIVEYDQLALKLGAPALVFASGGAPSKEDLKNSAATGPFNPPRLKLRELISQYRAHPESSYQALKFRVRINYDSTINRLVEEIGDMELRDFDADVIRNLWAKWVIGDRFATAHSLIGKMRLLCTFGITVLKDEDATRLSTILGSLQFPVGKGPRTQRLTAEHAKLIRSKAHEMRWHSLALIQAFQFDLADRLGQVDIIGDWVPLSEDGASDIIKTQSDRQVKWVRGIKWNQIDDRLMLRHSVSNGRINKEKPVRIDLNKAPMVMEEIKLIPEISRSGPLAICEFTGLPWDPSDFRRRWRQCANLAGIPKDVKNMDSGRKVAEDDLDQESRADAL